MKKILSWLFVLVLVVASWNFAIAETNTIDVNSMTFDELLELESRIENVLLGTILESDTELPLGRYVAGDDIAAGRYVITAKSEYGSPEIYVKVYNADNVETESYQLSPNASCKVTLKDGMAMAIDDSHSFEIHAEFRTMVGFFANSRGYSLTAPGNVATESVETVAPQANNNAQPTTNDNSSGIYTYLHDKWDLYKATVLSGTIIKVENWYRSNANDETPFSFDHSVVVINTDDGSSDFKWLNEEHTAFSLTMKDENNSRFKVSTLVVFTIGNYGQTNNAGTVYTYLNDKWDLYKATLVSDNDVKIDGWYRFNANNETPFSLDHSVMAVITDDGSTDFQWLNDAHTSFSLTMQDSENSRLETPTLVVFTIGE